MNPRRREDVQMTRSNLRLSDLTTQKKGRSKLMNVKVPVDVIARIDRIHKELGATKTDIVIALLNEGLDAVVEKGLAARKSKGTTATPSLRKRGRKPNRRSS